MCFRRPFGFPQGEDVWLPLEARATQHPFGEGPGLFVFGRLAEGATREEAGTGSRSLGGCAGPGAPAALRTRHRRSGRECPSSYYRLTPSSPSRLEIALIQGMIYLLLAIVCGNVALLVLARTAMRSAEISVRAALGASRTRIVTQIFVEAMVLAVLSTGLGLLAAEWVASRLVVWITPFGFSALLGGPHPHTPNGINGPRIGRRCRRAGRRLSRPFAQRVRGSAQACRDRLPVTRPSGSDLGSNVLVVAEIVLSVGFLAMGGTLVRSFFQTDRRCPRIRAGAVRKRRRTGAMDAAVARRL